MVRILEEEPKVSHFVKCQGMDFAVPEGAFRKIFRAKKTMKVSDRKQLEFLHVNLSSSHSVRTPLQPAVNVKLCKDAVSKEVNTIKRHETTHTVTTSPSTLMDTPPTTETSEELTISASLVASSQNTQSITKYVSEYGPDKDSKLPIEGVEKINGVINGHELSNEDKTSDPSVTSEKIQAFEERETDNMEICLLPLATQDPFSILKLNSKFLQSPNTAVQSTPSPSLSPTHTEAESDQDVGPGFLVLSEDEDIPDESEKENDEEQNKSEDGAAEMIEVNTEKTEHVQSVATVNYPSTVSPLPFQINEEENRYLQGKRALSSDLEVGSQELRDSDMEVVEQHPKRPRVDYEELEIKISGSAESQSKLKKVVQQLVEEQMHVLQLTLFDQGLQELRDRMEKIDKNQRLHSNFKKLQTKFEQLSKIIRISCQATENVTNQVLLPTDVTETSTSTSSAISPLIATATASSSTKAPVPLTATVITTTTASSFTNTLSYQAREKVSNQKHPLRPPSAISPLIATATASSSTKAPVPLTATVITTTTASSFTNTLSYQAREKVSNQVLLPTDVTETSTRTSIALATASSPAISPLTAPFAAIAAESSSAKATAPLTVTAMTTTPASTSTKAPTPLTVTAMTTTTASSSTKAPATATSTSGSALMGLRMLLKNIDDPKGDVRKSPIPTRLSTGPPLLNMPSATYSAGSQSTCQTLMLSNSVPAASAHSGFSLQSFLIMLPDGTAALLSNPNNSQLIPVSTINSRMISNPINATAFLLPKATPYAPVLPKEPSASSLLKYYSGILPNSSITVTPIDTPPATNSHTTIITTPRSTNVATPTPGAAQTTTVPPLATPTIIVKSITTPLPTPTIVATTTPLATPTTTPKILNIPRNASTSTTTNRVQTKTTYMEKPQTTPMAKTTFRIVNPGASGIQKAISTLSGSVCKSASFVSVLNSPSNPSTQKLPESDPTAQPAAPVDPQAPSITGSEATNPPSALTKTSRSARSKAFIDLTEDDEDDDVVVMGVLKPSMSLKASPIPSRAGQQVTATQHSGTAVGLKTSRHSLAQNLARSPHGVRHRPLQHSPVKSTTETTSSTPPSQTSEIPPLPVKSTTETTSATPSSQISPIPPLPVLCSSVNLPLEAASTSPPQQPLLRLTQDQAENGGIVLSWSVTEVDGSCAPVDCYNLYAYHQDHSALAAPEATSSSWKKIGEVKALALPMACTLTQFVSGSKYYFVVHARDVFGRFGPFSEPQCTDVLKPSSSDVVDVENLG
ncbi:hypothetical protein UPYG_G00101860 [Umbra pygmaea]|uniref:Fibronectin type-III domain-containing protein n=1 Tax=Umbra pygmaea TaxID=75934 RepID=A0ABD0X0Z3_UMBPY